ncbi:hypothetical protein HK099_006985, partial [Clydaea vesicula]
MQLELLPCSTKLACEVFNKAVHFQDPSYISGGCNTLVEQTVGSVLDTVKTRVKIGVLPVNVAQGYHRGIQATSNGTWREFDVFGIVNALKGHTFTKIINNKMLIYGGVTSSGIISNFLYELNYDNTTLTAQFGVGSVQPPPLMSHSAVFRKSTNELYILFGTTDGVVFNNLIYTYNIQLNIWSVIRPTGVIPENRTLQAVDIVDDNIYVFGGLYKDSVLKDFWIYSCREQTWTQQFHPLSPLSAFGSSLVAVSQNKTLILFGGTNGESKMNLQLWMYSINSSNWMMLNPFGIPPKGFSQGSGVLLDSRRILYTGGVSD